MRFVLGIRKNRMTYAKAKKLIDRLKKVAPDVMIKVQEIEQGRFESNRLFKQRIEKELLKGELHSFLYEQVDLPFKDIEALKFCKIPLREEARDAILLKEGYTRLSDLPLGAVVMATGKLRVTQLLAYRPDFTIIPMATSLSEAVEKVEGGKVDALVEAGDRLELSGFYDKITDYLPLDIMLPALGQGLIALKFSPSNKEVEALLSKIEDTISELQLKAEMSLLSALNSSIQYIVGGFCEVRGNTLVLRGLYGSSDSFVIKELKAPVRMEEALGRELSMTLKRSQRCDLTYRIYNSL